MGHDIVKLVKLFLCKVHETGHTAFAQPNFNLTMLRKSVATSFCLTLLVWGPSLYVNICRL